MAFRGPTFDSGGNEVELGAMTPARRQTNNPLAANPLHANPQQQQQQQRQEQQQSIPNRPPPPHPRFSQLPHDAEPPPLQAANARLVHGYDGEYPQQHGKGGGGGGGGGYATEGGGGGGPVEHKPWFTRFAMLVCTAMFAYTMYLNNWEFVCTGWTRQCTQEEIRKGEVNPLFGPTTQVLLDTGAQLTDLIVCDGEWWRLVTPMGLHAGVVHLLFNMFSLNRAGGDLEIAFGAWRVAAIFLPAGLLSSVASGVFLPGVASVGASGAIFGLLGAQLSDFIQNFGTFENRCATAVSMLLCTSVNLAIGVVVPQLNNFAHIGGFAAGMLLGFVVLIEDVKDDCTGYDRPARPYQVLLQVLASVALFIASVVGFYMLYDQTPAHDWCSWCQHLNCLPLLAGDCSAFLTNSTLPSKC